jgi:hypothetical protein
MTAVEMPGAPMTLAETAAKKQDNRTCGEETT